MKMPYIRYSMSLVIAFILFISPLQSVFSASPTTANPGVLLAQENLVNIITDAKHQTKNYHKFLTEEALKFLKTKNPEAYKEMSQYLNQLRSGSFDEEFGDIDCSEGGGACIAERNAKRLRHFYRPLDEAGWETYQNAYEWANAGMGNKNDFEDATEAYQTGNLEDAYYKLGSVLHLIQDMSFPENTHLEYHSDFLTGGERGAGYEAYVIDQYSSSESNCQNNKLRTFLHPTCVETVTDPFFSKKEKPVFNYYDKILSRYDYLKQYFDSMANLSYYRNRFQAKLDYSKPLSPGSGELASMFTISFSPVKIKPDIELKIKELLKKNPIDILRLKGLKPGIDWHPWKLESVGEWNGLVPLASDTWWETSTNQNSPDEPGWYYIENSYDGFLNKTAIPNRYKTDWASYAIDQMGQFGKKFKVPYSGAYTINNTPYSKKKILAEVFAEDLIPLAVQHTAGVMDLFWRKTHLYAPGLTVMVDGKNLDALNQYDYGKVEIGKEKTVVFNLSNTGTDAVSLLTTSLEISGPNANEFQVVKKHKSGLLNPGDKTEFSVKFKPSTGWERHAVLKIKYSVKNLPVERSISLQGGQSEEHPGHIGPEITVNAPTTHSSDPIEDTTIRVIDNWGLSAKSVRIKDRTFFNVKNEDLDLAEYTDYQCDQVSETEVLCKVKIKTSGKLYLIALDQNDNVSQAESPYYTIDPSSRSAAQAKQIKNPSDGEFYTVKMRCDVQKAMNAGEYHSISTSITSDEIEIDKDCTEGEEVKIRLFTFPKPSKGELIKISSIISEMKKAGYRPASALELFAFGADGPRQSLSNIHSFYSLNPVKLKKQTYSIRFSIQNSSSPQGHTLSYAPYHPNEDYGVFTGGSSQLFLGVPLSGTPTEKEFLYDIVGHPYEEAIRYLADRNVVKGYPDGAYMPSKLLNRAEFIKIVVEGSLGYEPKKSASNCFTDVKTSDWFASYVCYAKEYGIVSGYEDKSFKPGNNINLAEAAKIVVGAMAVELSKNSKGDWFAHYIRSLQELNYIPDSFGKVDDLVNRGQMAELIYRIMAKVSNKPSKIFEDAVLAKAVKPKIISTSLDVVIHKDPQKVTMRCNLEAAITAGKHDNIQNAANLKDAKKLLGSTQCVEGSAQELYFFDITTGAELWRKQIIDEMTKAGYRPATILELLALGAERPQLKEPSEIIALDEGVDGSNFMSYLAQYGDERYLEIDSFPYEHSWLSPETALRRFVAVPINKGETVKALDSPAPPTSLVDNKQGGYSVKMRCNLESAIKAGNYDSIDDPINLRSGTKFASSTTCVEGSTQGIHIFEIHANDLKYKEALDEIKKAGYRPAGVFELLALGADQPALQKQGEIHGFDTGIQGTNTYLASLEFHGEKRSLELYSLNDTFGWSFEEPQLFRFAVIPISK